jgi:hypothetical protein
MGPTRYWSVEECRWVDQPASEDLLVEIAVPQQREDEPAQEPVDA